MLLPTTLQQVCHRWPQPAPWGSDYPEALAQNGLRLCSFAALAPTLAVAVASAAAAALAVALNLALALALALGLAWARALARATTKSDLFFYQTPPADIRSDIW